jgi:DUF4097 and DUF4098 domain-containing protein YvlB
MSKRWLMVLGLLPCLLSACFLGEHTMAARDHFEETVDFTPGGTFRLDNVNGEVVIETWERSEVRIEAEKAAASERTLREIQIQIDRLGDQVEVRTRFPRRRSFFGRMGKVDYRIRVPAEARVDVETVNGKLQVEGIRGRVKASTVNGSIEIEDVAGEAEVATVNGSIRARYLEVDPDGRNRFSTTNGSVRLRLPPDVSGDFEARTVNGSIQTDFPLEVSGKLGRRLRGRLGEGRGSFEISTVNGSVRIEKL